MLCISRVQLHSNISIIDAASFLKHGCHIPWICYALGNRRRNFTWRFLKFCNIKNKHSGCSHDLNYAFEVHLDICWHVSQPLLPWGEFENTSLLTLRKLRRIVLHGGLPRIVYWRNIVSTVNKEKTGFKTSSASSIFYFLCNIFYCSVFLYSPIIAFLFSKEIHLRNSPSEILL